MGSEKSRRGGREAFAFKVGGRAARARADGSPSSVGTIKGADK